MISDQQAKARASWARTRETNPAWQRLAGHAHARGCQFHGRRCHRRKDAHHWSRRFYRTPVELQQPWMLVTVCRPVHTVIHWLSYASALGHNRVTWLPLWTGLVLTVGLVWQLLVAVATVLLMAVTPRTRRRVR